MLTVLTWLVFALAIVIVIALIILVGGTAIGALVGIAGVLLDICLALLPIVLLVKLIRHKKGRDDKEEEE